MTVAYQHILYETEGPVATITMNRPDQLNALTGLMQAEIRHALDLALDRLHVIVEVWLLTQDVLSCAGRRHAS